MDFRPEGRGGAYGFMRRTLVRLRYEALGRSGKVRCGRTRGKATGLPARRCPVSSPSSGRPGASRIGAGPTACGPSRGSTRRLTSAFWLRPTRSAANSAVRRSNDNALVEGKNASVRKWFGHGHIPGVRLRSTPTACGRPSHKACSRPYLNHHHPCLFATEVREPNGKVRHRYRRNDVATPYEKLKSLPDAQRFLEPGVTFAELVAN